MKKVLVMAKSFGGGGSEVALIELLNHMPEDEYDVTVVVLDHDMEYYHRLNRQIKQVSVVFKNKWARQLVSMYAFPAKVLKKCLVNAFVPCYTWLFDSVENRFDEEYDLALDFYGYGYFLTGYMAERICAKWKATWIHGEDFRWFKNVARYAGRYDRIFAVSGAVKESFCGSFPELSNKVSVFYNVIDTERIILKSQLPCDETWKGHFILCTVGRLHRLKGHDVAVEAGRILKKRGIDFHWYIIGTGSEENRLRRQMKQCGVEDCFTLIGGVDNPYVFMRQCDLYVQPSRHEGYSLALMEARVLCLPILASDIPANKEQIKDGINGYLVPLRAEKLAEKIEELYRRRDMLHKVSEQLRKEQIDFSGEMEKLGKI